MTESPPATSAAHFSQGIVKVNPSQEIVKVKSGPNIAQRLFVMALRAPLVPLWLSFYMQDIVTPRWERGPKAMEACTWKEFDGWVGKWDKEDGGIVSVLMWYLLLTISSPFVIACCLIKLLTEGGWKMTCFAANRTWEFLVKPRKLSVLVEKASPVIKFLTGGIDP